MDIKDEVRRHIVELTRFAYERGYRDGAQSALTEIESMGVDDVVAQLGKAAAPLKAIGKTKSVATRPAKAKGAPKAQSKGKARAKTNGKAASGKPKTTIVQDALLGLLASKGEARREDVLSAAQAENPKITKFDLGNGLRVLVKQSKVRVSSEDSGLLLPA